MSENSRDIPTSTQLAEIIKKAQGKKTDKEMAAELGVSRGTLDNWKSGQIPDSIHIFKRLADMSGLSMDDIYRGIEPSTEAIERSDSRAKAPRYLATAAKQLEASMDSLLELAGTIFDLHSKFGRGLFLLKNPELAELYDWMRQNPGQISSAPIPSKRRKLFKSTLITEILEYARKSLGLAGYSDAMVVSWLNEHADPEATVDPATALDWFLNSERQLSVAELAEAWRFANAMPDQVERSANVELTEPTSEQRAAKALDELLDDTRKRWKLVAYMDHEVIDWIKDHIDPNMDSPFEPFDAFIEAGKNLPYEQLQEGIRVFNSVLAETKRWEREGDIFTEGSNEPPTRERADPGFSDLGRCARGNDGFGFLSERGCR